MNNYGKDDKNDSEFFVCIIFNNTKKSCKFFYVEWILELFKEYYE